MINLFEPYINTPKSSAKENLKTKKCDNIISVKLFSIIEYYTNFFEKMI